MAVLKMPSVSSLLKSFREGGKDAYDPAAQLRSMSRAALN